MENRLDDLQINAHGSALDTEIHWRLVRLKACLNAAISAPTDRSWAGGVADIVAADELAPTVVGILEQRNSAR